MNKLFIAIAALLAVQAVEAQDYLPFQNPGASKCVVKGAFNKDNQYYAVKLGSCTDKNVAKLRHLGKGKELCTSDKYCFDTIKASDKADTELVLRKPCTSKCGSTAGLKWTKVGKNQWQNGNKQCLEYNTKSKKFQQRKCATIASDNKTSYQQWVFQAPPAPASIKCADWGKKWVCGKGYYLATTNGLTCVGATGSTCANVCCKPATTCQSAGYSRRCPVNYKFVNRECGNVGQKPCGVDVCCDYAAPPVVKCNQWNQCSRGYSLKPRAKDIFCTKGKPVEGPGYAPTCSNDICCDVNTPAATPITCGLWNEKFGQCNGGFELKSSPYSRQCYNPAGAPAGVQRCDNTFCCQPSSAPLPPVDNSITCKQWTGKCKAADGLVLVMKADQAKCNGADCANVCCAPDTCENWAQRVIVEATPTEAEKTGAQVCTSDPAYAGLIDRNEDRFKQPCAGDDGKEAVCKPKNCCVDGIMVI